MLSVPALALSARKVINYGFLELRALCYAFNTHPLPLALGYSINGMGGPFALSSRQSDLPRNRFLLQYCGSVWCANTALPRPLVAALDFKPFEPGQGGLCYW